MDNLMCSGIYSISHTDGRLYIGSAVCFKKRFAVHRCLLDKDKHHNIKLQRSWNKYGSGQFSFNILEVVDINDLIKKEQYYIDLYESVSKGFNLNPKAGNTLGMKHTEEAKRKMSEAATGRTPSIETRKKMSDALRKRKGEKRPLETCRKISEKAKGRKVSMETRKRMSDSSRGRKFTKEHAAKISAALKGREFSIETRSKISEKAKARTVNRDKSGRFA